MELKLPIVEEKIKPHQITTLHLVCAMAFIGAGAIIVVYNYTIPGWGLGLLLLGLGILGCTIFKNKLVLTPKINRLFRIGELLIAISLALYSFIQQWKFPMGIFGILSAVLIFAIIYERTAGDTLFVLIDNEGIKLPVTSRKRLLPWHEIELVVLRFGILSINGADDSFYQWQLATDKNTNSVDNNALETFCSQKVEENRKKRIADW